MNKQIFNLDDFSFDNYQLGSLKSKDFEGDSLISHKEGYGIYTYKKQISAVLVCFRKGYRGFSEYKGLVLFNNNEYLFNIDTTFKEIISILGAPKDQWNDGMEMCAEYSFGGKDIEIIWNVDGSTTLDYISMEIN